MVLDFHSLLPSPTSISNIFLHYVNISPILNFLRFKLVIFEYNLRTKRNRGQISSFQKVEYDNPHNR
jgi:hypothetical protein